jgi:hypothetical protein
MPKLTIETDEVGTFSLAVDGTVLKSVASFSTSDRPALEGPGRIPEMEAVLYRISQISADMTDADLKTTRDLNAATDAEVALLKGLPWVIVRFTSPPPPPAPPVPLVLTPP